MKHSHHAQFNEAWYLQPTRPPAAHFLYDLGLEVDYEEGNDTILDTTHIPWPPIANSVPASNKFKIPPLCITTPLPLRETQAPQRSFNATAACLLTPHESSRTLPMVAQAKTHSTSPSVIVA